MFATINGSYSISAVCIWRNKC